MKIICIGRNYLDHVKELDRNRPANPVFFMKPDSAILRKNRPFYIPSFSNDLHYEVELVLKVDRLGKNIAQKFAHRYYSEIGLGIDFTARDLQRECIEKGLPWEISKAFDYSAVISEQFIAINQDFDCRNIDFKLDVNGEPRQVGNSAQMIFSFDEIIAYVSKFVTLKMGDLIYTGTPAGVGPVAVGDRLQGYIGEQKLLDFKIK